MRVFISSLITGMSDFRAAARRAAETLRHTVTVAEDFGASAATPQQVCLQGVRDSDVVVLLMGERYGAVQPSGLSATHEEYREARGTKPVLVFVQDGADRETEQEAFLNEVSTWEGGGYRVGFTTPSDLESAVTRALHELELSQQRGAPDDNELTARAAELLPSRSHSMAGSALLHVVVAAGPPQQLIRPRDLDDPQLHRDIAREAVFGDHAVMLPELGVQGPVVHGDALVLAQQSAQVALDEQGNARVTQPARKETRTVAAGLPSLIEEDVRARIAHALAYIGWLLDRVDHVRRLSRIAVAARIDGVGYLPWRTRAAASESPNRSAAGSGLDAADSAPVALPRAALLFDTLALADDITVRLRRGLSSR